MRTRRTASLAAIVVVASGHAALADKLNVRVVEVAGGVAYLDQGRAAGIVRGTKVKVGRATLTVTETTEKTCVADLAGQTVSIGATGTADVTPGQATTIKKLPPPRPAEAFNAQWPEVAVPSSSQTPKMVPLGASTRPSGRVHIQVLGHGFGTADKNGTSAQGEARVISTFDLMADRPLAVDLDVAGRAFRAGANSRENVPVFVRAAQIRYGDAYDPRFALGRLRYAASSLGMLDGARAGVKFGTMQVAAFGGIVPDPINGKPDTGAARFGGEAIYDNGEAAWRPRVAVTAYGSTWDSKLDERRLSVTASASREAIYVDGWAEAQSFASDNPWGAHAVELTGAGTTLQYRQRSTHAGMDVTFLRPERSLRLAAALPREWLCTTRPQTGNVPNETCTGGDNWVSASAFAGLRGEQWSLDATGAIGRTNGVTTEYDANGYLAGEVRFGPQRLLLGTSGGRTSFARWIAAHAGVGFALSKKFDVAVRYRPEILDYVAATGRMVLHSVVLDGHLAVNHTLDIGLAALGTTGADRDAVALLTTVAWRPLP